MGVRAVARAECSRIPHHKKPPRPLRPLRSSLRPPQLNLNTAAAGLDRQPAAFAGRSSPHQPWFEMAESHRNTWRVGAKRTGRLAVAINARAAYAESHGPGRLSLICRIPTSVLSVILLLKPETQAPFTTMADWGPESCRCLSSKAWDVFLVFAALSSASCLLRPASFALPFYRSLAARDIAQGTIPLGFPLAIFR